MTECFLRNIQRRSKITIWAPEIQKLIHGKEQHFNLLMIEMIQYSFYAFKHKLWCPVIGLLSLDTSPQVYEWIGNIINAVANPNFMLPFAGKLSFVKRLISVLNRQLMRMYVLLKVLLSTYSSLLWRISINLGFNVEYRYVVFERASGLSRS